jgi:RNA recognition motif-containing protein
MYCADVIKNKQTDQSLGYGFIEFGSRSASERFLKRNQGTIVPSSGQCHRMDWATCNIVERHSWYCEGSTHNTKNASPRYCKLSNPFGGTGHYSAQWYLGVSLKIFQKHYENQTR